MYTNTQIDRMLEKLRRFEVTLENLIFKEVTTIPMAKYQTLEPLCGIPQDDKFIPCAEGDIWGECEAYCWFKGSYRVPEELAGQDLYLYPKIGGYEAMLWVNKVPYGIFTSKIIYNSHGNHYCNRIRTNAKADEVIDIALEYYAHHEVLGTQPFEDESKETYDYIYEKVNVCLKDEQISDFYFDLKTINQMVQILDKTSYRRAELINVLNELHENIYYDYDNTTNELFRNVLSKMAPLLKKVLASKNSASAPRAGVVGHSHMDTAWLWTQQETLKKCARTYANQMNLMEQYPEYTFIQSSAYHSAMIKENYPDLFKLIKARVAEGRYEPNGGVWIECDCNLPSGEYLIRQFVWGQKFTKENFDYESNAFWLPDTFGYSVSLPQIMKGCHVDYFLTTKMGWNDTNIFPYDTFYWRGLDGSKVLVHMNKTHIWPDPEAMDHFVLSEGRESIQERTVTNKKLLSYGFGDGGGGPQFEMIEMARRLENTEGMPITKHTTVGKFMQELEDTLKNPSVYSGELYLELHRGTLTNQHTIKRNNRLAEIALHNLEYMTVQKALQENKIAEDGHIRPLMDNMLQNQFHDILPGTCIPKAHREAIAATSHIIETVETIIKQEWETTDEQYITLVNTLSFDREDVIYLEDRARYRIKGDYRQQKTQDINGKRLLAVSGVLIPAFGSVTLEWEQCVVTSDTVFQAGNGRLDTPFYQVKFQAKGYIESLYDKKAQREIRGEGDALNTLLIGEEVSQSWDSWDVDADFECRLKDAAKLLREEVISDGAVEYRIRRTYRLTDKSTMSQDTIFYCDTKEVRFDTLIDWQDEHRFLKTAFDTTIFSDITRQEVQFGYIKRPTTRNTTAEKAKFEVSNQKYTDLSESRYGAALLNDCKYGISVHENKMHLSLHKGGTRPDTDKGAHFCRYALLPHEGDFNTKNVICPSYEFNYKPLMLQGKAETESIVTAEADNIIVETVKPMESKGRGFVIRIYEAEGARTQTRLNWHKAVASVCETDMLEEGLEDGCRSKEDEIVFRPFEIKTFVVIY